MDTDREHGIASTGAGDEEARGFRHEPPPAVARPAPTSVAVYAVAAGAASVVPVPVLDVVLAKLARGSAMRRVAARRGVRLTPEARAILARPGIASSLGSTPARLLRAAITRALAPVRVAARIEDATATLLSAILLDHYLATANRRRGAPLGEREATLVRAAMESAWAASGLEALRTAPLGALEVIGAALRASVQPDAEARGPIERFVDALLDGLADAPEDLIQRMRDHFDAAIAARAGALAR